MWLPLVPFSTFFLPLPRLCSAPNQHVQWPGSPAGWDAKPCFLQVCLNDSIVALHELQPQGVGRQGVSSILSLTETQLPASP